MNRVLAALLVVHAALAGCERSTAPSEPEDDLRGPYPVSSTNMEVAPEFAAIGDDAMDTFLMGRATESGETRFLSKILKYPDAAGIVDVPVPDNVEMYGEASGRHLPVVAFVTFPSNFSEKNNRYAFPYHDAQYGVFENMLGPSEAPTFTAVRAIVFASIHWTLPNLRSSALRLASPTPGIESRRLWIRPRSLRW